MIKSTVEEIILEIDFFLTWKEKTVDIFNIFTYLHVVWMIQNKITVLEIHIQYKNIC